jgi:hypothetical protein
MKRQFLLPLWAILALLVTTVAQPIQKMRDRTLLQQATSAPSPDSSPVEEIRFGVMLTQSLDAHSAKAGDPIHAKLDDNLRSPDDFHIIAPRGSRVLGHVTEAESWSKDKGESKLGITFDAVILHDKSQVPIRAVILQVLPPAQPVIRTVQKMSNGDDPMARAAGPMVDNSGRVIVPSTNANDPARANPPELSTAGAPTGVPTPGWRSAAAGSGAQQTTAVFLSHKNNVKLTKETRIFLRLIAQPGSARP